MRVGRYSGFSLAAAIAFGCSDFTSSTDTGAFTNLDGLGGAGAGALGPDASVGGASSSSGGAGAMMADIPLGAVIGESCEEGDCRPGLTCTGGVCEATGETESGDACVASDECADGLICTRLTCGDAGDAAAGEECFQDGDCEKGLRCAVFGFSTQCAPQGDGATGADCSGNLDCLGGLQCIAGQCAAPPALDLSSGLPVNLGNIWPGEDCEDRSTGEVRAYFEVPGATDPEGRPGDFFRLPYPNDALLVSGSLDLTGFPTPGDAFLGYDPLQPYVDALEDSATGFSPSSIVYFRFSGVIDFDSLNGKGPVIVDVTPGDEGQDQGGAWFTSASSGDISSNKYICHNWLAVRRDRPYQPGRTYAVLFISDDVVDDDGRAIRTSDQLGVLLADATPDDSVLAGVHEVYEPLRDFLADEERAVLGETAITADNILNATVFTVEQVNDPMEELAAAVYAEDVPVIKDWVKCDDGVESPCPQAEGGRACGSSGDGYDEYHALIELPIWQTGTPPYLEPEDGGGIDPSAPERTEDVCMSVTVPTGGDPTAVAAYGHGTGGSFRSNVRAEVAGTLADVQTPGGTTVRFITVGIDQPQHGPRRGESDESPDNLFFNFRNPLASRGNPMQGAADFIALGRALQSFTIPGDVTGGDDLVVEDLPLVFFGHSQGSTHGSLAMPFAEEYRTVVFSGNGGSLRHGLMTKTSPQNIPAGVALALQEFSAADLDNLDSLVLPDGHVCDPNRPDAPCGVWHPALNLLQQYIDPADPLNFASVLTEPPGPDETGKDVFQTLGVGDTYSPVEQMILYAHAGGFTEVSPDASASDPVVIFYDGSDSADTESPPYAGASTNATIAIRQYGPPDDADGHFVVFDVGSANADVARFLAMGTTDDEKPAVGE